MSCRRTIWGWDRKKKHDLISVKQKKETSRIFQARKQSSSPTQGQSVASGEKAGRKFLSTDERAPGYPLSPNYFQQFKQTLAPDWAQKMLCIIVPNRQTVSRVLFVSSYTTGIVSPHLPGSFTKLVRARETFIFYFPKQKQRNYRCV